MDDTTLSMLAGALLSLLFAYIPGLADWYNALDGVYKRLMMAGVLLAVALLILGAACTGLASDLGLTVTCDRPGVLMVLKYFLAALIANQSAYSLAVRKTAKPNPYTG